MDRNTDTLVFEALKAACASLEKSGCATMHVSNVMVSGLNAAKVDRSIAKELLDEWELKLAQEQEASDVADANGVCYFPETVGECVVDGMESKRYFVAFESKDGTKRFGFGGNPSDLVDYSKVVEWLISNMEQSGEQRVKKGSDLSMILWKKL
jgi:hypothetical protein